MSSDGFGDTTRGDGEQIGRGAGRDTVIANAERLCAGGADQVEASLAIEIGAGKNELSLATTLPSKKTSFRGG